MHTWGARGQRGGRRYRQGHATRACLAGRGASPCGVLANWAAASVTGAFLLLGGNGGVVWAARHLPSGVSSLLVSTTPLWIVGLDWARPGGRRPSLQVLAGLAFGAVGLVLLVGREKLATDAPIDIVAALVVLLGTMCWATGSVVSRTACLPSSTFLAAGMQQLTGGTLLLILGLVCGEGSRLDLAAVTPRSWWSFLYLLTVGSLVAFTAYVWLLKVTTPARVATYAYVNPVVAVFLGWAFGGERLTPRMFAAAGVIVLAVVLITADRVRATPARPE